MPPTTENFAEFLTVSEAAEFLGVSSWTLRNWDKSGKLTPQRHPKNGYRIYRHEELSALLPASRRARVDNGAPTADWTAMGEREHFVQFYEKDEFLAESVAGFVGAGIADGDAAVVICTPAHAQLIANALEERGLDLAAAISHGLYQQFDAAEALARFMVDGAPDPRRFQELIGGIVTRAKAGNRRLRAFGEMVAILWAQGNRAAAIALEELWNQLAGQQAFALFCAYPIQRFGDQVDGQPFADICKCHTRVIPAESYAALPNTEQRLRAISRLQQKAQSLETEIAHRREVEEALSRRERELLDFVENASEGIHKVGADGTILWANRAELELLGYQPEEYIGHHIAEFHADRDVIDTMLLRLTNGDALSDCPARMRCKDGSIRHVEVNSNAFFENGRLSYTRCFTRDVTARWQAEERQLQLLESERAARAEAERVSRMKDEFLATLSHELRTPLNAMFGWCQIVMQSPSDPETVSEGITIIDRNVRLQTRLIEDLLDMSRIISGKVRLDLQRVELVHVLRAAIESARPCAQAKEIEIKQVIDSGPSLVAGDPNRLQQVIWNLLSNAIKFTPKGGTVEVHLARRDDAHLEVTVSDTGDGIKPEFLPHVFERFRQADASTTRKHGGLGLGLSIVKQLVELHGGTVGVNSAGQGQGSSFTVSIPLLPSADSEDPSQGHQRENAGSFSDCDAMHLDGVRVLVVDDEADARSFVARLLRDCGADVITADGAEQALEAVRRHSPQVLVSDIGMPETDGLQLIRQIRALSPAEGGHVAAVALTAFARSQDRTRALLAGYQLHIPKPVEPQELIVSVASLASRSKAN